MAKICLISDRKIYYKSYAFVVKKIDYTLQQRQIVKGIGKQIGIEDPAYMKYTIVSFLSIAWMLISVIVTINRTALRHRSHIATTKLRSSI
jgi:hypothetical protein